MNQQPHNPFPVVGVGASAGGLEAFTQLLQKIPADSGMAFVVIQHLDPQHESILAGLLAKVAKIPVHEVKEGRPVEPNHIYVIPPEMDMALADGGLSLMPRTITRGQHMPIDTFFCSLADIQAGSAIGIILSGNGSDGALGVQEIHSKGGIILVQDPSSAKFDGMPRNAIATGCAHFILPPEGIAKELARIGHHPYVNDRSSGIEKKNDVSPASTNALDKIFGLMRNKTGVDFSSYKRSTINRRIQRRMVLQKTENLSDYLAFLKGDPAEVDSLYNDILIKVTRFFRDPDVFEILKSKVFEEMIRDKPSDAPIRFWVPACSTGEEVYSLAICLLEFLGDRTSNAPIQIFGTDISDKALEKARAGLYIENIEADVSPERLRRFFTKEAAHYQVNKSVRELCIFAKQNMVKDPPFSKVDLISCRNALIYLGPALQKRVLPTFHFALNPQGRLLLGSSETVGHFSDLFTVVDQSHRIFAKNAHVPVRLNFDYSISPYAGDEVQEKGKLVTGPPTQQGRTNVHKEIDRAFLNRYTPAGVVVNDNLDILQFRGDTSPYLVHPSGEATFKLFKMLREGLQAELDAAIKAAKAKDHPYRKNGLRFKSNGEVKEICLEVIPIKIPLSSERYWGVMFREIQPRRTREKSTRPMATKKNSAKPPVEKEGARRWKQEMVATKAYLESVIEEKEAAFEELQSANEEVLSSNEELQSINEEMQTAKEELQSTNEELTTVNDELRHSNLESIKLFNDLTNLVDSVNLPIIIVGNDLTIRRFTPEAGRVLHLLPGDVGRPFRDINTPLDLVNLEKLILDAIDTVSIREQKIKNGENLWYSVRIRPYKTTDKKIDGAVITLIDIEDMKRTEEKLAMARDAAEDILNTVREPLVVLDSTLRVQRASASFYQEFNTTPQETEGRFFYALAKGQWNIPKLRDLLAGVIPNNNSFMDFEVDLEFPEADRKTMVLNAAKISPRQGDGLILLAIEDITERKRAEEQLRRAEQKFRLIVEAVVDYAIIMMDVEGRILTWNSGAERRYGYTREDILGRHFRMFFTDEDQKNGLPDRALKTALTEGRFAMDGWRVRKDGSLFWASVIVTTMRDSEGIVFGFSKITRDMTEHKKAQQALIELAKMNERKQAEERFRLVVEAAPSGMIMADSAGKIVFVNIRAEKIFGYNRLELIGKTIDILVPLASQGVHKEHRSGFHGDPTVREMGAGRDLYGLRKDGTQVPIEIGLTPITTNDGLFVLTSIIDISERKRIEEVRHKNEELEE